MARPRQTLLTRQRIVEAASALVDAEGLEAVSVRRLANELGARYMLIGDVQAIEDQDGREKTVLYQVDATLVDLESNAKVWAGQHKIKKYIERGRFSL